MRHHETTPHNGAPAVELRPLAAADLEFLCAVRHHPETLNRLHDNRRFSLKEVQEWFAREQPQWYIIWSEGARRGYVRTSERDERNRSLQIGADIHPAHRRRGYARAAYRQLLDRLLQEGWHRLWLEVLSDNEPAIRLYEQLGFRREGVKRAAIRRGDGWLDSVLMSWLDEGQRGRHAKVIVVYLGPRRSPPHDARDAVPMLEFLLERERQVDPGCPTDTLLVHNHDPAAATGEHAAAFVAGEALLAAADGTPTRRGSFRLLTRENVGLSFGGYNHAFSLFAGDYDYWLFTEDDHVMLREGYFRQAIEQMQDDPTIGFVATVGVSQNRQHPPHAHGGVGVSSRAILRDVQAAHPCRRHPEGHLPYHAVSDYDQQEALGEIRFTNAIHQLGYRLIDLALPDVCVSWGNARRRTPRVMPWSEELVTTTRSRHQVPQEIST